MVILPVYCEHTDCSFVKNFKKLNQASESVIQQRKESSPALWFKENCSDAYFQV